jgi:hypothetical protein
VEYEAGIFLVPGQSFALAMLVEEDVGPTAAPVSEALRILCGYRWAVGMRAQRRPDV